MNIKNIRMPTNHIKCLIFFFKLSDYLEPRQSLTKVPVWLHREIFSESCQIKPKSDCIYNYLVKSNRNQTDSTKIAKSFFCVWYFRNDAFVIV